MSGSKSAVPLILLQIVPHAPPGFLSALDFEDACPAPFTAAGVPTISGVPLPDIFLACFFSRVFGHHFGLQQAGSRS